MAIEVVKDIHVPNSVGGRDKAGWIWVDVYYWFSFKLVLFGWVALGGANPVWISPLFYLLFIYLS